MKTSIKNDCPVCSGQLRIIFHLMIDVEVGRPINKKNIGQLKPRDLIGISPPKMIYCSGCDEQFDGTPVV